MMYRNKTSVFLTMAMDPTSEGAIEPWMECMPKLFVIMGVSGCGKSVVGTYLKDQLGIPFIDGDELHPPENIAKMSAQIPLTDEDRQPWLQAICEIAEHHFQQGQSLLVACSALKKTYRDVLRTVSQPVIFLHLKGPLEVIQKRLDGRAATEDHFMPVELLQSQFATLEDPAGEPGVIEIDIIQDLESMLDACLKQARSASQ